MSLQRLQLVVLAAMLGAFSVSGGGRADAADQKTDRADFSGSWTLNEQLSEDPLDKAREEGLVPGDKAGAGSESGSEGKSARGRGRRGRPAGSGGGSGVATLPWELLEGERRLVIEDHGAKVQITRGPGRQRTLFADGEERELDEGDGPAKVTARRKGPAGEKILVSVRWSTGRRRDETWEIQFSPRRLVVTTNVKDRRSISFRRVYEPASGEPEEPASPATPVPASTKPALMAPTPPAAAAVAGMSRCAIRPPRGTGQDELARMAKVSQADAANRATSFAAPRRPTSVISSDVEVQEGCLVWSFVLRFSDKPRIQEVAIDAGDGKVLSSESEE